MNGGSRVRASADALVCFCLHASHFDDACSGATLWWLLLPDWMFSPLHIKACLRCVLAGFSPGRLDGNLALLNEIKLRERERESAVNTIRQKYRTFSSCLPNIWTSLWTIIQAQHCTLIYNPGFKKKRRSERQQENWSKWTFTAAHISSEAHTNV